MDCIDNRKYMLITPAHNEGEYIENTINSVVCQHHLPARWIIVNDRSTDETEEIVKIYMKEYDFIRLLRIDGNKKRHFGGQVRAINAGYEKIKHLDFNFIGNLDADVTFEAGYYEEIIKKFQNRSKLGIAGGFIYEKNGKEFESRPFNNTQSVANAIQLFSRDCYEEVGGYIELKYGGHDWVIELMARMKGWQVQAFPELRVFHHRPGSSAGGIIMGKFQQGLMDYSIGSHPLFEVGKCLRRFKEKPYFLGALFRMAGFIWPYFGNEKRQVPDELIKYLRSKQKQRVRKIILENFKL